MVAIPRIATMTSSDTDVGTLGIVELISWKYRATNLNPIKIKIADKPMDR
jgi:hypothetical protein